MYLTNAASKDLVVLPTHRLVHHMQGFDEQDIMSRLATYFSTSPVESQEIMLEKVANNHKAIALAFPTKTYLLFLKPEAAATAMHLPAETKDLALTAVHHFILNQVLGIKHR